MNANELLKRQDAQKQLTMIAAELSEHMAKLERIRDDKGLPHDITGKAAVAHANLNNARWLLIKHEFSETTEGSSNE